MGEMVWKGCFEIYYEICNIERFFVCGVMYEMWQCFDVEVFCGMFFVILQIWCKYGEIWCGIGVIYGFFV